MVAPGIVGFCKADVNAFGPLQLYVAPVTVLENKLNVCPAQIGELAVAVGVVGIGFTTTATVPGGLVQPATVAVTEYTPAASVDAPTIVGFNKVDELFSAQSFQYLSNTIFD